jgi:hypothetical protein
LCGDVRCHYCECETNNEQPSVVGAGTKSCGVRTSVNKEHLKSKATSNSPVYCLRQISAYGELQTAVTEVGQVKQTATPCNSIQHPTIIFLYYAF